MRTPVNTQPVSRLLQRAFIVFNDRLSECLRTRGGIPDRRPTGPIGYPRAGPGWASVLEVTVGNGSGSVTHFLCVFFPFLSVQSWDFCFSDSSDST